MPTSARYLFARSLALGLMTLLIGAAAQAQVPVITAQPQSQTLNVGETVNLVVTATGATTYQWYQNGVSLANGGNVTGSTSAALTITLAQQSDSGSYTVTASNSSGYVTSSPATVTVAVLAAPVVSGGRVAITTGLPYSYTVVATGQPTSFGATGLPSGLNLNTSSGIISGTALQAGTFAVQLSAANSIGIGTTTLTMVSAPPGVAYVAAPIAVAPTTPGFTGIAATSGGKIYYSAPGDDTIYSAMIPLGPFPLTSDVAAGASGQVGGADGPAANARFFGPTGLAADSSGNVYIADTKNDTIRVLSAAGTVTTLAGQAEQAGSSDGQGSAARFNGPGAVAVGSDGTVYVADTGNDIIRRIATTGNVTTLAGSPGVAGSANGTGSAAEFNAPGGIAVDASGNVYVSDTGNDTIRLITPGGVVTTLAGQVGQAVDADGAPSSATFAHPAGIAVDLAGDLFVADTALREIVAGGLVKTIAPVGPAYYLNNTGEGYSEVGQYLAQPTALTPLTGLSIDATGDLFSINGSMPGQPVETIPYTPPQDVALPVSGQYFLGSTVSLTSTGASPALSYDWFQLNYYYGEAVSSTPTFGVTPPPNAEIDYITSANYEVIYYNAGAWGSEQFTVEFLETPTTSLSVTPELGGSETISITLDSIVPGEPFTPDAGTTYQWFKDGAAVPGATASTLSFGALQASDSGDYTVQVTTPTGSTALSQASVISLDPSTTSASVPTITAAPTAQVVYAGTSATLSVAASGGAVTYQWMLNGAPIPGATAATLTVSATEPADAGGYSVVVSNAYGSVSTPAVPLAVDTTRLANLSVRGTAGNGADALIVGFVTEGAAPMDLLVRGIGPGLASFGITMFLATPQLDLYDQAGTLLATDAGWGGNAELATAFSQVGAFSLAANSADSALLVSEPSGSYTAQVSGLGGTTGTALAEIYDADVDTPAQHLLNLSARGQVGTGSSILIGGFVVTGNSPENVLVRGIGPGLGAFGLTGVLAQPQLQVISSTGTVVASNAGWGGSADLAAAFAQVGAFALASDSADAALLVTLPPGSYTAQLSGVDATTGLGLLEIYELR